MGSALLLGAAALFFTGTVLSNDRGGSVDTERNSAHEFQGQTNQAVFPLRPRTLTGGTILHLDEGAIMVATQLPGSPMTGSKPASGPDTKIVLNDGTEIYKQGDRKSDDVYQKDMQEFLENISTIDGADRTAPDPFEHISVSKSDLRPGMFIIVYSSGESARNPIIAEAIQVL